MPGDAAFHTFASIPHVSLGGNAARHGAIDVEEAAHRNHTADIWGVPPRPRSTSDRGPAAPRDRLLQSDPITNNLAGSPPCLRDIALDPRHRGRDVLDVGGMHHAGREAVVHDNGDMTGGRKPLPDEGLFRLVPLPQLRRRESRQ